MFTTSAMTGLRMNRSVKLLDSMAGFSGLDRTRLGIGRLRRGLGARDRDVVDLHRHGVAELEDAGGHDLLTGLDALGDDNQVAARGAELHKLLADAQVFLALVVLHLLDDV